MKHAKVDEPLAITLQWRRQGAPETISSIVGHRSLIFWAVSFPRHRAVSGAESTARIGCPDRHHRKQLGNGERDGGCSVAMPSRLNFQDLIILRTGDGQRRHANPLFEESRRRHSALAMIRASLNYCHSPSIVGTAFELQSSGLSIESTKA